MPTKPPAVAAAPLPHVPPPSRLWLRGFEVRAGQPVAVGALFRALGPVQCARLLGHFAWRQLRQDPLDGLPPAAPDDVEEWLARRQFAPVVLLDDALRIDLGLSEDEAVAVLREVVGASGAAFLGALFPELDPVAWLHAPEVAREALVRRTFRRFGNIAEATVQVGPAEVGFDVLRCRFHSYCQALDRLHLAPLFCHADAVFFEGDDAPYRLERPTTLAGGGSCCAFRIHFKGPVPPEHTAELERQLSGSPGPGA